MSQAEVDVLIIGAGIFGVSAALALKGAGHNCILLDSQDEILKGASANNQNRLHTGLHYPRDRETAEQSLAGAERFLAKYSPAVNGTFLNYYFIAKNDSKTSVPEFESFADLIGVKMARLSNKEISRFGINASRVSAGWHVDERVIDISILRPLMQSRIESYGIPFYANSEVIELNYNSEFEYWNVFTQNARTFKALHVVICTYGFPIKKTFPRIELEPRLFQATIIPVVSPQSEAFGATVMDGDFITVLPRGFRNELLLYGPEPSVAFESRSLNEVQNFLIQDLEGLKASRIKVLKRTGEFFPNLVFTDKQKSLITIRALPIDSFLTDERRSYVRDLGSGIYQIISGKVDHAPQVADQLVELILAN